MEGHEMPRVASWQPLALTDEDRVIWTADDGTKLVRLLHPDTVKRWAEIIGHSGGNYTYWVCERRIWTFLTFIDEWGFPHATFHLKSADAYRTPQPEDELFKPKKGSTPTLPLYDAAVSRRYGVPSTTYDAPGPYKGQPMMVDGEPMVLMAMGHRDADNFVWSPDEGALAVEWLHTLVAA